jgi:hypothetical protein
MVQPPPAAATATEAVAAAGGAGEVAVGNGAGGDSTLATTTRGFLMSFVWVHSPGNALVLEREYDGAGQLGEVRLGSAVKGGWAGGRM